MSHGQATVERGFSVNKQTETDNLACDTFEAQRLVCDHVAAVGGIQNIDVKNKQLKGSVKEPNILTYFFFPLITQSCSVSDVLFTGGTGVSDFSVLKYY